MMNITKKHLDQKKNKQYIKAIESYKNADLNENELKREVERCEALQKIVEGYYKEAAEELLNLHEYKYAIDGYLKCEDYLNVIKCGVLAKMTYKDIINILSFVDLDIIDYVTDKRDTIDWYNEFKSIYEQHIKSEFDILSKNVENIIEAVENISIYNR